MEGNWIPLPPLEALLGRAVVVCREVGCGVVPMDRGTGTGGRRWAACAVTWPGRRRPSTASSAALPCG